MIFGKSKKTGWNSFNITDRDSVKGAGIMYCLKYSEDRLKAHRDQIIEVVERMGWRSDPHLGVGIGEVKFPIGEQFQRRSTALLEELSIINSALDYKDKGFEDCKTIEDLRDCSNGEYSRLVLLGKNAEAYEFIGITVPRLIKDLRTNGLPLRSKEIRALEDLEYFVQERLNISRFLGVPSTFFEGVLTP